MPDAFVIANCKHVADGTQQGQFGVGERKEAAQLGDLDPIYRQLLDRLVTMTLGPTAPDGRVSPTPMWFDYEGDKVLVNTASRRPKCDWIRRHPRLTMLLVNPGDPYHWVQIRCTVEHELREWEAGGERVTERTDRNAPETASLPRMTPPNRRSQGITQRLAPPCFSAAC